jgi:glucose/arabinose dehydrogenase
VAPNDGTDRLFVLEQAGIIRVFHDTPGVEVSTVFLDIRPLLGMTGGELGLLGLAFDPDFRDNGYFYVSYTADSYLRTIVARYRADSVNTSIADPTSEKILLVLAQPSPYHKSGELAFGPDGYLYIGIGDGGYANDPPNYAQNDSVLYGKILRVDVHSQSANDSLEARPYGIPDDNPYAGNHNGIREEIYASGLRNPWRFSFDTLTGRFWCADVGQDHREEIDIVTPGGNYGWRTMEGKGCNGELVSDCDTTGFISPIWDYSHDSGIAAIGGYVYRGAAMPELQGRYIFADFGYGQIWGLDYDSMRPPSVVRLADSHLMISSFGLDRKNELLICAYGVPPDYQEGGIYKLEYNRAGVERSPQNQSLNTAIDGVRSNGGSGGIEISYRLEAPASVRFILCDLLGNRKSVIVDGNQSQGAHRTQGGLPAMESGTYFLIMEAGDVTRVRSFQFVR